MANKWTGSTPNLGLDIYNVTARLSDDITGEEVLNSIIGSTNSNAVKIDDFAGGALTVTQLNEHNNSETAHSSIWLTLNNTINNLNDNFYTKPQANVKITDFIQVHNVDHTAHGDIRILMNGFNSRLTNMGIIVGGGIAANPFSVTFGTLDGLDVEGVWNRTLGRIEF